VKCMLFSLLGDGSAKALPRQRNTHATIEKLLNASFFYAVRLASKERRLLVLPRTSIFTLFLALHYVIWDIEHRADTRTLYKPGANDTVFS
jgi:hypothetical protein